MAEQILRVLGFQPDSVVNPTYRHSAILTVSGTSIYSVAKSDYPVEPIRLTHTEYKQLEVFYHLKGEDSNWGRATCVILGDGICRGFRHCVVLSPKNWFAEKIEIQRVDRYIHLSDNINDHYLLTPWENVTAIDRCNFFIADKVTKLLTAK